MKIIKNLHIIHKDKFDREFIEFINNNFKKEEHFFLLIHLPNTKIYDLVEEEGSNILNFKFKKSKKIFFKNFFLVLQVLKFYKILYCLSKKSKKIFFHSIADYQMLFLYIFRSFLKKSYYAIWSTEKSKYEDNYLFNKVVKYVKGNFKGYITHIKGDYNIIKERYGAKGDYFDCFTYPSNLYKKIKVSETSIKTGSTLNIQIGNSAQMCNNHIEILEKLKKFKDKNIKLFCILSYGNDGGNIYLNEVIKTGKKIFKDKFVPILNFFPHSEYIAFLNKINIAIFAHNTQKAFGNIISLLSIKKTVYLKESITTYKALSKLGIKLKSFDKLEDLTLFDTKILENNQKIIMERFSKERLINDLKLIFYDEVKE
jgi:4-alpha-L-fucosyltransferase (fuc4NAc transferase)